MRVAAGPAAADAPDTERLEELRRRRRDKDKVRCDGEAVTRTGDSDG